MCACGRRIRSTASASSHGPDRTANRALATGARSAQGSCSGTTTVTRGGTARYRRGAADREPLLFDGVATSSDRRILVSASISEMVETVVTQEGFHARAAGRVAQRRPRNGDCLQARLGSYLPQGHRAAHEQRSRSVGLTDEGVAPARRSRPRRCSETGTHPQAGD